MEGMPMAGSPQNWVPCVIPSLGGFRKIFSIRDKNAMK